MAESFFVVAQQVVILFILMSIGVLCNKIGWLDSKAVKSLTNIVLYFVTPCVIINSFNREMDRTLLRGLWVTALLSFGIQIFSIILASLVFRGNQNEENRVLRFASVFSNCGFMGLPLQQALLGTVGAFFGAVYIAVFNVIVWTYGIWEMSGKKEEISLKKLVLNPGILGTAIGMIIFLLEIRLPEVVAAPVRYLACLNTPLPMIIIGYYLGNLTVGAFKKNLKQYLVIALRLFVVPVAAILAMYLLKVDSIIAVVCVIACAAPTASITAMFATLFGKDASLGAQMVSVSTLISLISIPLVVTLARLLIP